MAQTLEVEIDEVGNVHALEAGVAVPAGRATLVWGSVGHELYKLSESALSDWLRPEEDEAWAAFQPDK